MRCNALALGYENQTGAEQAAVHARLESLMQLAFALSGAIGPADVAELVVEQGMRQAGADICTLYALDESGECLDLLAQRGVAAEVLEKILHISKTQGNPRVLETLSTGDSVWAENEREYDAIFPEVARLRASGARAKAFWSVPLVVEGHPVGLLGMGFYREQRFSVEDRRFVETFAKLCAQAVQRAVRREREIRAERRRAFLARAMETLVSSLDFSTTLKRVAELVVPELADWCTIDILDPGSGKRRQIAVAHHDPAKVEFAREVGQRYPPDLDSPTGSPQVMRSGKSELYPEIPMELVERAAVDAEHLRILRELKLESAMIVAVRSETGKSSWARSRSSMPIPGRRYTAEDLSFAEDFARRAAMAIENARATGRSRGRTRSRADPARASRAGQHRQRSFLATVSHELRTPLNAILGWAVVLRERGLAPGIQRALGVIERNARAQLKLIEELLDVSRIISGKSGADAGSAVNVGEAVRAAVLSTRPAADAKGISLSMDELGDERGLDDHRGRRSPPANPVEPAHQRGQIHAQGRLDRDLRGARRLGGSDPRQRYGRGDPGGRLALHLPSRFRQADSLDHAPPWRARLGPVSGQSNRGRSWRHRGGQQLGCRARRDVRGPPAGARGDRGGPRDATRQSSHRRSRRPALRACTA